MNPFEMIEGSVLCRCGHIELIKAFTEEEMQHQREHYAQFDCIACTVIRMKEQQSARNQS